MRTGLLNIWVSGFCALGIFTAIQRGDYPWAIGEFVLATLNLLAGLWLQKQEPAAGLREEGWE